MYTPLPAARLSALITIGNFDLYKNFATEDEITNLQTAYDEGISWGDAKEKLFLKNILATNLERC